MRAQIIVVATVLASVSLGASQEFDLQPDPDDVADLRAAGTFRCNFDGMAEVIIDDVDYRDGFGSARFIGNLGTDDMLAGGGAVPVQQGSGDRLVILAHGRGLTFGGGGRV